MCVVCMCGMCRQCGMCMHKSGGTVQEMRAGVPRMVAGNRRLHSSLTYLCMNGIPAEDQAC